MKKENRSWKTVIHQDLADSIKKKEKLERRDKHIITNKMSMIFTGAIVLKDTARMKEKQAHNLSLLKPSQS